MKTHNLFVSLLVSRKMPVQAVSPLQSECRAANSEESLFLYNCNIPGMRQKEEELRSIVISHTRESRWQILPLWVAWATQLDNSGLWYVMDDEYETLISVIEIAHVPYVAVRCGEVSMKIIGYQKYCEEFKEKQEHIWCDEYSQISEKKMDLLAKWAKIVHENMKLPGQWEVWESAYQDAVEYFQLHRQIVRYMGQTLGLDMEDHDLSKTRLFHYALGYLWHWKGDHDSSIKDLAWEIVRERHLKKEDHHPEFTGGQVDSSKLFCDRLSVHLQKDREDDGCKGWGIAAKWLPPMLLADWETFKEIHMHKNLYKVLDKATSEQLSAPYMQVLSSNRGV